MKRILFFTALFAATAAASQQPDTAELLPVEVKAIRAGATAPFAKTNISRQQLQRQNLGQDLPFLLAQTPSVVASSDAGNGVGYTGIRIRGTDATRINVTLNGVPFNDPESAGAFFVNLPDIISSAGSVQIQRGVGTSTNGGSAFGGTINLSTHETVLQPYLEAANSYGSFDTWKNTLRAGTGLLGNHFTADLRLSQVRSSGFIDRASTQMQSYYFSTAYLANKTTLRFTTFSGKEKTYQAWYGVSEADRKTNRRRNIAGTEKPGEPYANETDNYTQTHYQLFLTQKLRPSLTFNTGLFYVRGAGYYEQYKAAQRYSRYGLDAPVFGGTTVDGTDLVRQLWLNNHFYGNIFSVQYSKPRTEITVGGSAANYLGRHFGDLTWAAAGLPAPTVRWYDHGAIKNDWNLYSKWQQKITRHLQAFVDLQVRGVAYKLAGFRDNPTLRFNQTFTFFNPKAGLTFTHHNWTAFASYAVANREPVRDDFETGALQAPRPERLHDLELGAERKTKTVQLGATVYYMRYTNQLVLTGRINDVGAYTRTNIPESYRLGLELQGSAVIGSWLRAAGNLTLSRNRIKNFTEYIDDFDNGGQKINRYSETDISFSPALVGAATISILPTKRLSFDLVSKYVGRQYLDNTGNKARSLNPFFVQDLRGMYAFGTKSLKNVDLIFQVNNLLNAMYEPNGYTFSYFANSQLTTENFFFPMAGINYTVGVTIKL